MTDASLPKATSAKQTASMAPEARSTKTPDPGGRQRVKIREVNSAALILRRRLWLDLLLALQSRAASHPFSIHVRKAA